MLLGSMDAIFVITTMLALDKPGPELKDSGRAGEREYCVLVNFRKEGPRQLSVISRAEALGANL